MTSPPGTIRYTCAMHRARDRQVRRPASAPPRTAARSLRASIVAIAAAATLAGCSGTRHLQPDLVIVTVGAFPVESLACFGGGGDAELGAELCSVGELGSRFVWAFSTSGSPAPAMATILTGLSPDAHGVEATAASFLRNDHLTLAEHFSRAGYTTAAFVTDPALNRSRHFDQGFGLFDDGFVAAEVNTPPGAHREAAARAAQWLSAAPSPFLAWVHIDPGIDADADAADALRQLDRTLSRLLAVLDARTAPPAILVTGLPAESAREGLTPARTRVALLWRPPRIGGGQGVTRVIRTPVSQLDVAPTLLRATGLVDAATHLPGRPLPFRERRAGEAGRTLEIRGFGQRALIGEGVYLVVGEDGSAMGVAQLPLAGERAPALGRAEGAEELASRLWAAPEEP